MKRWIFVFLVLFVVPFVFAEENGCCAETITGETCRYTVESNCATPGEYFSAGATCETRPYCGTGCCVTPEGGCADGSGAYSCALLEGAVYYEDQECESVPDSCTMTCCQLDSDYMYLTTAACAYEAESTGIVALYNSVSSESDCYALEHGEDLGCCVDTDGCHSVTQNECGTSTFDSSTGYGFYPNDVCFDISSDLDENGLEAAEVCDCQEDESLNYCNTLEQVVSQDTCLNDIEIVEDCYSQGKICSSASGVAECVTGECVDTFSFPEGSYFENFNSYPVYYQTGEDSWDYKDFTLGKGTRKNGESWCIYESPVGSFRDRVGSQHYVAFCQAGEEIIMNCASDRTELCIPRYDASLDQFSAACYLNNFDEMYGIDYRADIELTDLYIEHLTPGTEDIVTPLTDTYGRSQDAYGFSTVTSESEAYCDYASVTCQTLYGDGDVIIDDEEGWELYVNGYCLTEYFSLLSADLCASRGKCGIKENIIGSYGGLDGSFIIDKGSAFNDVWGIGCGNCFDAQEVTDSNFHLSRVLQCDTSPEQGETAATIAKDAAYGAASGAIVGTVIPGVGTAVGAAYGATYGAIAGVIDAAIQSGNAMQSGSCDFYTQDSSEFQNDYFIDWSSVAGEQGSLIILNLLTEDMRPYWLTPSNVFEWSGAAYTDCITPSSRTKGLLYSLGSNVYPQNWYTLMENGWPSGHTEDTSDEGHQEIYDKYYEDFFDSFSADCDDEENEDDVEECETEAKALASSEAESKAYTSEKDDSGCGTDDPCTPINNYIYPSAGEDIPYPLLFNNLRSIKPWVFDAPALQGYVKGESIGDDFPYLTLYDGDSWGCGLDSSEWLAQYKGADEFEGVNIKNQPVTTTCSAWTAPADGDCSLCDKTVDEGGLIFNKGDILYEASYCNQFRCESLGVNCKFVGDNYGSGHESCVDENPCEGYGVVAPQIIGPYVDALEDSDVTSTEDGSGGYTVSEIPVKKTISFGLETNNYAQCVFLEESKAVEMADSLGVGLGSLGTTDKYKEGGRAFYDYLKQYMYTQTPQWGGKECSDESLCEEGFACENDHCVCDGSDLLCVDSMTKIHNTTVHLDTSEELRRYYVWCKDSCDGITSVPPLYIINLQAAYAPPEYPPSIVSVYPTSGSQVPYASSSQQVSVYVDIDAECRYSSSEADSYDSMTGTGSCVENSDDSPGYTTECSYSLPLQDGTTTIYFLCSNNYNGAAQTQATQWYVSKSEALEITQTAPSGTLYYNDIYLTLKTDGGVGSDGTATCSYALEGETLQDMAFTGGSSHEQALTRDKGDYVYDISCTDSIGNVAETQISFSIDKDVSASEIESVYYLGSTLYVITNEASNCQWDNEDFSYGGGTDMAGTAATAHTLTISDFTQPYVIVCVDGYGNEMSPFTVDFEYFL